MTDSGSKVTVIVPVYNAAVSLARCLESILVQTRPADEIILVNDGSTDASVEVIRRYQDKVKYLEQDNLGPSAARNAGLARAGGDYVAFLDADDYWLPEFLETCAGFLERYPEAIAVSVGQKILHVDKEYFNPTLLCDAGVGAPAEPMILHDFFDFWARHNHITTGSVMIRKGIIDRAGPMQTALRISEDWEYWGYLATYGLWGFIPRALFVGDGVINARTQGWLGKHRTRWARTPTVEQWQSRIISRLDERQREIFFRIRGRVAKNFAHCHILAGRDAEARRIVETYGLEFPPGPISRAMQTGARLGRWGWKAMAGLLRVRETVKAVLFMFR